jgi:mRNA interferase MazF
MLSLQAVTVPAPSSFLELFFIAPEYDGSMEKDFWKWHKQKAIINSIVHPPFFSEREIWFCCLGANVGFEQDGRGDHFLRPIIVGYKFNNDVFWAIPLTRARKRGDYYFEFSFDDGRSVSVAVLSQIRLVDARRLSHKVGIVAIEDFHAIKQKLKTFLP